MKRSFASSFDVEGLSRDKLWKLRSWVDKKYREKAHLATQQFFTYGCDVFTSKILPLLTHSLKFNKLRRLREVCRDWCRWVGEVDHLQFGDDYRHGSIYRHFLECFVNVVSIKSHQNILYGRELIYGRITHLEIKEHTYYEKFKANPSLYGWKSLTTLILPLRDIKNVQGLWTLPSLTSLTCRAKVFEDHNDITHLTNLKSLTIVDLGGRVDISCCLPLLTYLNSDHPLHFSSFTGHGVLSGCDCIGSIYEEQYQNCDNIQLEGEWLNGVLVKGDGLIQWDGLWEDDDRMTLSGSLVDGKFEGSDIEEECYEKKWCYRGSWKAGVKHGPGIRYKWEGLFYDSDDKTSLIPVSREMWCDGKLVDKKIIDSIGVEEV
jgi:hypothetical protein